MRLPMRLGVLAVSLVPLVSLAPPASADEGVKLPGTDVTLYESAGDPMRLTSYYPDDDVYLRDRSGDGFARQRNHHESVVSPGGRKVAATPAEYTRADYDELVVIDRATGAEKRVRTVRAPQALNFPNWTKDSRKVVATIGKGSGSKWRALGFSVIDTVQRTHRAVYLKGLRGEYFLWGHDGRSVLVDHGDSVRRYSLTGKLLGTLKVGGLTGGEEAYSPNGKHLITSCPKRYDEDVCLSSRTSGKITRRVRVGAENVLGWWNDSHFIAVVKKGDDYQAVVTDLRGKAVKVIADISEAAWEKDDVALYYTRG